MKQQPYNKQQPSHSAEHGSTTGRGTSLGVWVCAACWCAALPPEHVGYGICKWCVRDMDLWTDAAARQAGEPRFMGR